MAFAVLACLLAAVFPAGCGTAGTSGESASGPEIIEGPTTTAAVTASESSTITGIAAAAEVSTTSGVATAASAGFSTSTGGSAASAIPTAPSTPGYDSSKSLIGHVHADDPSGDVNPFDVQRPARQPACADLVSADLTADGKNLTIRLTTSEPIPHSFETKVSSDDQMVGLEIGIWFIHPTGGFNFSAYLWHDWELDERMSGPPQVSGNTITITVPLASVPELTNGFQWTAYANADFMVGTEDEKYGDRLPGIASAGFSSEDPALPFPDR